MSRPNLTKAQKEERNQAKRIHRVGFNLNARQLAQLKNEFRQTGGTNMSGFIRAKLGLDRKSLKVNSFEIIKTLDKVGAEVSRISDNMHMIAHYTDTLVERGDADMRPINEFNLLMDKYTTSRRDLVKAYRALVRVLSTASIK